MSDAPTILTEATGLPARHAHSCVSVLSRLCDRPDLPALAGDALRDVARAVGCDSASLSVYDPVGRLPRIAHVELAAGPGGPPASEDEPRVMNGIRDIVAGGRADPSRPFFTLGGSFWTNSLGPLLSGDWGAQLGGASRGAEGLESVAIAPVRSNGRVLGVVQTGAREPGVLSPEDVEFLEWVGLRLGAAVEAWRGHEELLLLAAMVDTRRAGVESMLAIGEMVSTIAHDIKNPLAGMMLAGQRLKKLLRSIPGQEKLADIADHLCLSIESLSDTTSRLSSRVREPALEMSRVDIHDMLGQASALSARRAEGQGVKIVHDLAARESCVRGDAHLLRRAILDLMTNALDAMPSEGELLISTSNPEGGRIEAVVADTGEGLDAGAVETLFRPFVTTRPGAAGLGLPLARRIGELHGATVALRPRPSGGAEAVLEIPLALPEAPAQ